MINIFSKRYQDNVEKFLGEKFVVKRIHEEAQNGEKEKTDPLMKKLRFHMVMQFIKVALIIVGIIAIGRQQDTGNRAIYLAGIVAILLGIGIHLYTKRNLQETLYIDSYNEKESIADIKKFLEIPDEADTIEIMYTLFDTEGLDYITYLNEEVFIFYEESNLCLATRNEKLSIPIYSIKEIREIKKEAALDAWNKKEGYGEGRFKQYQIKSDASIYDQHYLTTDYGRGVIIPYYYSVRIGNDYEFLIPPYEVETVSKMIGISY